MNNYVDEAMEIAHNKEQSIFQQRNEFQQFIDRIIEDSKEKLLEQIKKNNDEKTMYEINNPRY